MIQNRQKIDRARDAIVANSDKLSDSDKSFAYDLLEKAYRFNRVSQKQEEWIYRLANRALGIPDPRDAKPTHLA